MASVNTKQDTMPRRMCQQLAQIIIVVPAECGKHSVIEAIFVKTHLAMGLALIAFRIYLFS